jgi:hypothetical protein
VPNSKNPIEQSPVAAGFHGLFRIAQIIFTNLLKDKYKSPLFKIFIKGRDHLLASSAGYPVVVTT